MSLYYTKLVFIIVPFTKAYVRAWSANPKCKIINFTSLTDTVLTALTKNQGHSFCTPSNRTQ